MKTSPTRTLGEILRSQALTRGRAPFVYFKDKTLSYAEMDLGATKAAKGFASINCVYGIGSYTYQYNTRDTFGFALKSTLAVINGVEKQIFKDPKTDDGTKKSMKGKVMVFNVGKGTDPNQPGVGGRSDNQIWAKDGYNLAAESEWDLLHTIYLDGKLVREQTFSQIRAKLNG